MPFSIVMLARSILSIALIGFGLSASAQSLYTPERGLYGMASDQPLDHASLMGETRLLGVEAGYRTGTGIDISLAVAGSESSRTLALSPSIQYTARVSERAGVLLSGRGLLSFREGYRGGPNDRGIGGLVSTGAYVHVPISGSVDVFPQLGISAGVVHATRTSIPGLEPDTQPLVNLDMRLPVAIGHTSRLVVVPTLSVPLMDDSQFLVQRITQGLGVGISL